MYLIQLNADSNDLDKNLKVLYNVEKSTAIALIVIVAIKGSICLYVLIKAVCCKKKY